MAFSWVAILVLVGLAVLAIALIGAVVVVVATTRRRSK
jgi:hypothetical protein